MNTGIRVCVRWVVVPTLALGGLIGATAASADDGNEAWVRRRTAAKPVPRSHHHGRAAAGHGSPGFQGFGLGYHLGYGYGGDALGVEAFGGYPFYGGPGYPHPAPRLRRMGGINPFAYYGGPGYATPESPNYFSGVGPLVVDRPVVTTVPRPGEADHATSFGPFTGTVPYAESRFAPMTSAAAGGAVSGASNARPAPPRDDAAPSE